jgi:predicted amidohydrolase YtcJ
MWADLVLHGATVVTLDATHPRARSLAIKEGRIVYES